MTLFARTLERYQRDFGTKLPFLLDSPPANLSEVVQRLPGLRAEALESLLQFITDLKDRQAASPLLELLRAGDVEQAHPLAHAIATMGGRPAATGLLELLDRKYDAPRRLAAAYGLTWLMDQVAFEPLLEIYRDPREPASLRTQAAEALIYLLGDLLTGEPAWRAAEAAFLTGLGDADAEVRFWSVYALGTMRSAAALPKLRELAARDAAAVRHLESSIQVEAQDAIRIIEQGYAAPNGRH